MSHRCVRLLLLAIVILVPSHSKVLAVAIDSGVFVLEIERLKDLAFAKDSGLYVIPDTSQRSAFASAAAALIAGNLTEAETLVTPLGYEVVEFTDVVANRIYHGLREQLVADEQTKGWGSYFVDLNFASESLVEVTHPVFDTNSWYVGARAFQESRASEFLMAGAHRNANGIGTADVAHLNESIFQEVHQAWNGVAGETTPWQIHGFSLTKHPSFPAGTDAVLSNGDGGVTTDVIGLDGTLDGAGFLSHVYNTLPAGDLTNIEVNGGVDGSTFSSLGATSNVQGLHSRGLGGEFVHIELAQSIRFNMENIDTASLLIAKSIAVPEPSCLALYVVGIAFLCLKTPSQEVKYCGRFF